MKRLIPFMQLFTLSCEKATLLMEMDNAGELSSRQKRQLVMHKSICRLCKEYHSDSVQMDAEIDSMARQSLDHNGSNFEWTDKDKHDIIQQLNAYACDHGPVRSSSSEV